ncbi:MAG: hypothetical protein HUU55_01005 [Myxococcales bacterium]|nr:hypothetical protein [Myxococcales bacterium]
MKRRLVWVTQVLALFGMSSIGTAVPQSVSYVGELSSPNGVPITADVMVTVALFGSETGAVALWSEDLGETSVIAGRFDIEVCKLNCQSFESTVEQNDGLWLEFTVGGQILTPRQKINSVPFALRAGDATTLGGISAAEYVTSDSLPTVLEGEFAVSDTACPQESVMTGVDAAGLPICDGTPFSSSACSDCLQPVVDGQTTLSNQLSTITDWINTFAADLGELTNQVGDLAGSLDVILAALSEQSDLLVFVGNGTNNHGVDTTDVVPNPVGSVLERLETLQGSPGLHGQTMMQSEFLQLFRGGPVVTWSVKINNGVLDQSVPNAGYTNLVQGRSLHGICQVNFGASSFAQVVAAGSSGYEAANYTAYVAPVYPVVPVFVIKDAWSHGPGHVGVVIASSCHTYANEVWSAGQCGNSFADRYLLNNYTGYVSFVLPCVR